MLLIKDVVKKYYMSRQRKYTALKGINLEISEENMIAIMGESGSGKSTLVNMISTLDTPSKGHVSFNDEKITFSNDRRKSEYRKENIGFVFQTFNLLNDISVLENVAIAMEIAGVQEKPRFKRAQELLELVGLKDHLKKKPGQLSGGQKQRVAIARALANNPKIILADEPTGALDSRTSKEIMSLLKSLVTDDRKLIIVTHDKKVANYCERIIVLDDGEIVSDEKIEAVQLPTVELPKPVEKSSKGLTFKGIYKLSISALKRRLKRTIVISLGTAIALSSLLIVNFADSTIYNHVDKIRGLYGNGQLVNSSFYLMNYESIPQYEKKIGITDDKRVISRVPVKEWYLIESSQHYITTIVEGEEVPQPAIAKWMFPDPIETFGTGDLALGTVPKAKNEVAISQFFVDKLGYTGKDAIGKTFTLTSLVSDYNNNDTLEEVENEFVITGIFSEKSFKNRGMQVYLTYEFTLDFEEAYFQEKPKDQNNVQIVSGKVLYEVNEKDLNQFIDDYKVLNSSDGDAVYMSGDIEELDGVIEILNIVFVVFNFVLAVSLLVAAIMIGIMLYISILERMREIGVLRAIGARVRDIRRMFYLEALVIGVFAGIFAIIISLIGGYIGVEISNHTISYTLGEMELFVHFSAIVIGFLLSIVLAIGASAISIAMGLRITPVEALRRK